MTQFNNNFDHELGWDDEIVTDAKEFVQLTPGDYQLLLLTWNVDVTRQTHKIQGNCQLATKQLSLL